MMLRTPSCDLCHVAHHQQAMHIAAGCFGVVGQVLEDQSLMESPERCGQVAQVIGRADDKTICLPDIILYRRQPVFTSTAVLVLFLLAGETGDTAGVSVQPEKVESLYCSSGRFCASRRFFNQCIGVPALTGSGIDRYDFPAHEQPSLFPDDIGVHDLADIHRMRVPVRHWICSLHILRICLFPDILRDSGHRAGCLC